MANEMDFKNPHLKIKNVTINENRRLIRRKVRKIIAALLMQRLRVMKLLYEVLDIAESRIGTACL